MNPNRLAFSIQETADLLDLHYETIYRAVRNGRIRAFRLGREWRIPRAEVERLLAGDQR